VYGLKICRGDVDERLISALHGVLILLLEKGLGARLIRERFDLRHICIGP